MKKVTEDLAIVGDPLLVLRIQHRSSLLAVGVVGRVGCDERVWRRRSDPDVLGEASTLEGVGDLGMPHAKVPPGELLSHRRKEAKRKLSDVGSLRHGDECVVDWIYLV